MSQLVAKIVEDGEIVKPPNHTPFQQCAAICPWCDFAQCVKPKHDNREVHDHGGYCSRTMHENLGLQSRVDPENLGRMTW